jgi:lipopolysaccharide transport system ATP-binding protein
MSIAERSADVEHAGPYAVEIRNLTKTYKLYPNKSARVAEVFDPFRRVRHTDFQALRDVSIKIPVGATVGILGVNGSGKSTLLQLICGIIEASTGDIRVNGRIAALLELGAGFNPDLSGRDNVVINGLILGLSRRAIDERMPEIEAFAEVGDFFDHPVKIYSSGMLMRVAFAMAVHVDPDILIIDEALAVGDARFQQKCFRRFNAFQQAKKTIILVTHDRFSVPRLCTHGLVLKRGEVKFWGDPKQATEVYGTILTGADEQFKESDAKFETHLASGGFEGDASREDEMLTKEQANFSSLTLGEDVAARNPIYNPNEFRSGRGGARIVDFMVNDGVTANPSVVTSGRTITILVRVAFNEDCSEPNIGVTIQTKEGIIVFAANAIWLKQRLEMRKAGDVRTYQISVRMDLGSQDWFVSLAVANGLDEMRDQREALFHLRCESLATTYGLASLPTTIAECAEVAPT